MAMGTGICRGNGGSRVSGGRGMLDRPRGLEAPGAAAGAMTDTRTYWRVVPLECWREGLVVVLACRPRALEGGVEPVAAVE